MKRHNRKALLAAGVILSGVVIGQSAAVADDAGQADAGADGSAVASPESGTNYYPNKNNPCSVAPHGLYGTALVGVGAGCC